MVDINIHSFIISDFYFTGTRTLNSIPSCKFYLNMRNLVDIVKIGFMRSWRIIIFV